MHMQTRDHSSINWQQKQADDSGHESKDEDANQSVASEEVEQLEDMLVEVDDELKEEREERDSQ